MIERQRPAPVAGVGDDGPPGVVGAPGPPRGPGQEDRRDGVEARVPGRVRVGAELADKLDVERGLLAGLAHGGGLERLAVFDEAAGQRPAGRRVPALDEHDAPPPPALPDLDDDVDGGEGIAELAAGHGLSASAAIVGAFPRPCQRRKRETFPVFSVPARRREGNGYVPFFRETGPRMGTVPGRTAGLPGGKAWHKKCCFQSNHCPGTGGRP